ncbi:hypothetical protein B0H13DRAFT_2689202 [Mycena leptocephala]|nr:hypothetical protein B0H13DRAFT_2689202 [Mycena leptocephala]
MHRQSILHDLAPTRSLRRERRVNEPWRDPHGSDLRLHRGRVRSRRRRFVGSIVVLAFRPLDLAIWIPDAPSCSFFVSKLILTLGIHSGLSFVTLVYVFAWRFAHRIGRQGTTRSEMSWAAPGNRFTLRRKYSVSLTPVLRTSASYLARLRSLVCLPIFPPRCLRSRPRSTSDFCCAVRCRRKNALG